MDPKTAWAINNRHYFPVDINTGTREQLLRVPGLGVRNVERILKMRPYHNITMNDLRKLRVPLNRAKYFLLTSDHNPNAFLLDSERLEQRLRPASVQLSLFETATTSLTGEI